MWGGGGGEGGRGGLDYLGGEKTEKTEKIMGPLKLLYPPFLLPVGPVVRRPVSTNPRLNVNPGFFFFCSKAFS